MADRPRKAAARGEPKRLAKGVTVTVMIDRYFGIHQHVIRSGLSGKLSPSAILLYLYVSERSEFFCSREIKVSDSEIHAAMQISPRTLTRDRQQLNECGIIQSNRPGPGYKYTYTLCDPLTKKPYPGNPKVPIRYVKRPVSETTQQPSDTPTEQHANTEPNGETMQQDEKELTKQPDDPAQSCPIHGWKYPCAECVKDSKRKAAQPAGMTEHGVPLGF
jgi:hypothetical protein